MSIWDALWNVFRGPAATAALDPMLAGQRYAAIADTSDEVWNRAFNAGYAAHLGPLFGRDVAAAIEESFEDVRRAAESLRDACAAFEPKETVES